MTIGDLCDTVSETYHGNDDDVILINTSDVYDGKILNHERVPNSDLKGQFKKTFQTNDILFSEIRPANRRFAFVDIMDTKKYIASTKLMVLRPKSDVVLPRYLFAMLKSKEMLDELQMLAETRSGTFPQITFSGELAPVSVLIPDFDTQSQIVQFLSIVEEKISINSQINDNLEQQAAAIYSSMFALENADNTTIGVLRDIAEITMGQSPNGSSYNEDSAGEVFYQGRAEFGARFPTRRLFTTEPKRMAEAGDVLISVRAPVGDLNVAYERCCIGRGLGAIHSKTGHQSYILYTMFALRPELDVFNGEGTVFGSINRDELNNMPVIIPAKEKMDAFELTVSPIDAMIRKNYEENCRLQEMRDALLPKLMSGEIDVSAVQL